LQNDPTVNLAREIVVDCCLEEWAGFYLFAFLIEYVRGHFIVCIGVALQADDWLEA